MNTHFTYNLLLDDDRTLQECYNVTGSSIYFDMDWVIVRNYDDFCKTILDKGLPAFISFDHDIADFKDGEERDGKTCAWFIVDYCMDNDLKLPDYVVHSANNQAEGRIGGLLDNFKKTRGY